MAAGAKMIFVFGSNLAGLHGAGAALYAKAHYGAMLGVGIGRTGNAYAIPTKDHDLMVMSLLRIRPYVNQFLKYAKDHSDERFLVTRIGCGLAGYVDKEIAPIFIDPPTNCIMPIEWKTWIVPVFTYHHEGRILE